MIDINLDFTKLIAAIYYKYKYDFADYSRPSIKRQIELAIEKMGIKSITALQEKIVSDPKYFADFLTFCTIPVSEMFRDPTYFRAIRETILPALQTYPSLKIWIAGCSTGEEVYSFAILLKEAGLLERTIIYATDINRQCLDQAEAGVFKLDDLKKFTTNYQKAGGTAEFSDYYTAAFDHAIFKKSLKKNIIFSDHSLGTDNVFTESHLISCRNVFIYFEQVLQDRALGLFHNSLCEGGFLGLGPVETIEYSKYANAFTPVVLVDRLYQKVDNK